MIVLQHLTLKKGGKSLMFFYLYVLHRFIQNQTKKKTFTLTSVKSQLCYTFILICQCHLSLFLFPFQMMTRWRWIPPIHCQSLSPVLSINSSLTQPNTARLTRYDHTHLQKMVWDMPCKFERQNFAQKQANSVVISILLCFIQSTLVSY